MFVVTMLLCGFALSWCIWFGSGMFMHAIHDTIWQTAGWQLIATWYCHIDSNQITFGVAVKRMIAMIDSQASFTERLGNTSWCYCVKCLPMPRAVEYSPCRKVSQIKEYLESSDGCVMCLETFKTVFLDVNVLHTVLVMMHTVRGDRVETPITIR